MPELRDESAHVSVSGFDSKLVQEVRPTIARNFEPKSDLRLDSFSDSLLPKISFRWKPEHEQTKMHQMYLYIFTYLLTYLLLLGVASTFSDICFYFHYPRPSHPSLLLIESQLNPPSNCAPFACQLM